MVATLCAAFVWAAPGTASAQTFTDPDAAGDMAVETYSEEEAGGIAPAPERTRNDVSNTTLVHGVHRLAIRVDYVDLGKGADEWQGLQVAMVSNEGARRYLLVSAWPRHWSGEAGMYDGRDRTVRCALRHSIDYEANVVKVSFPRRCAGNPRWVKFQVVTFAETPDGLYVDDALRDGAPTGYDLASSGRVYREAID